MVAQLYVATVIIVGASGVAGFFPRSFPQPILFAVLLVLACLTSVWKVNLPISVANGSTLSVSYAANLMSLLLLGPQQAVIVGIAGAWTQCTYKVKQRYPVYRTVFSTAAEAIAMIATGVVYTLLNGPFTPVDSTGLAQPLVAAIATYFLVNTALIAGAIAASTQQPFVKVWRDDFLWIGASFMVAGSAGAIAAIVVARGQHWQAVLLIAPIYLTYRTYQLFVGRLDDQKIHIAETRTLHEETMEALRQTRQAEQALAQEKERLALMLADMTRLEDVQHQLLEREQAARASAEQANRLKDQFLAIVSHELRTPLNAILGWSDLLRRGSVAEPRRERALQVIYDSATRQAQLIDDLLDVARIVSGKLRLDRAIVDLEEVVREALQVVQPAADAKRIRIGADVDPSVGAVYGDGRRLQQIVWNLLANAVKFTPEGGAVRARLRRAGGCAEIVVTDTGQGIARDFLPSIFEPFRQADGSTTRVHAGLGLGLAIVKNLVEAHGGTVTAESGGEGRGATFLVRLPTVDGPGMFESGADRRRAPVDSVADSQSLAGTSVLIVDDDEETRHVVAAHLENHHAAVLTAGSAREAYNVLKHEHVDVLLSDIAMPGEDGYALIRKVRGWSVPEISSIPAAALTALAREEDRRRALQAGFQLHLTKPIDERSLVAAVANLSKSVAVQDRPSHY